MRKICYVAVFTLMAITSASCSYLNLKSIKNNPGQAEQLCAELKRNITFNTTAVPTLGAASATQQAQMTHLYDKYGCSKLEKNTETK